MERKSTVNLKGTKRGEAKRRSASYAQSFQSISVEAKAGVGDEDTASEQDDDLEVDEDMFGGGAPPEITAVTTDGTSIPSVETDAEFDARLAQGMENMRGRSISVDTLNFGGASEDEDSDGEIEAQFMDDLEGTDLSSFGLVPDESGFGENPTVSPVPEDEGERPSLAKGAGSRRGSRTLPALPSNVSR